ncbi:DUF221-domain-containing protein [Pseudovirgaria hyperparasitica]|uniref:DUF221-domain-containing protein n=1 Tax=Pseudovirgaria hyperparasitica TaxID=470096 RepID=A0A6A6W2Q2_9PEZI|nr:DUF221-domain-containing protein [Pseudovirgaria hyperparasitica]KAF2755311.1 DUF221-domain-containing protein [Pseudovirgaria hyperparasitica]
MDGTATHPLYPRQSAQTAKENSNSVQGFTTVLVTVGAVALVWLSVFLLIRTKFPRRYLPRTFVKSLRPHERTPAPPNGVTNWFGAFWSLPDSHVLQHSSLDGYFFLRFLKIAIVICLVGCVITFPVLFPVDATGGGTNKQLDIITLGNISNNYYRLLAHAGCAYIFFGFVLFMITRESIFYINLRQAFLMSPMYAQRMSSRTVLYTSVPDYYLDEGKMREMLGPSVRQIWLPTDTTELEDLVSQRDKATLKLEGAETKLGKLANAARLKAIKKGGKSEHEDTALTGQEESGHVASRWIAPKQRPTHRLKPLIGKKVDTINWARDELAKLIPQVAAEQQKHRAATDVKKINSVFVEFDSVNEAQAAFQSLTHHQVLHMSPRYTGINPEQVIWSNLKIKWWERVMRGFLATAVVTALVIFWSIPVSFSGFVSNIDNLIAIPAFSWLSFINSIPGAIRGVITGLLPVIYLAVLMALLPPFLRFMAKVSGDPTLSAVELSMQNYYFAFQVVQVFFVATVASAVASSVTDILDDPGSVTSLLSENIPKASNFYLSYFTLQGLQGINSILVGLIGVFISIILSKILDTTPRKIYKRWTSFMGLGWGTVFPVYTNLLVIAIIYSCIAPLVLFFAAVGFFLFYLAYRYNLLYVYDINVDTQGLVYPRALQHLFVGLYVAEICLIGLFAINSGNSIGALISLILMIIFIIFTALYHISLSNALGPLLTYLPKSLQAEEQHLMSLETGLNGTGESSSAVPDKNGGEYNSEKQSPAPHPKPNMLTKFLKPHIYNDYQTMRRMVPRSFVNVEYEPQIERDAFFHPAIRSEPMLIWIPRDPCGVSKQEIADTSKVIPITDEAAHLDDKNKIVWDADANEGVAPIHEEKIYY